MNATTHPIKDFFTEEEWDAIFDAICEYQDHGSEEFDMSRQIQSKISKLFNWNSVGVKHPTQNTSLFLHSIS